MFDRLCMCGLSRVCLSLFVFGCVGLCLCYGLFVVDYACWCLVVLVFFTCT